MSILIKNATITNEGKTYKGFVLIEGTHIVQTGRAGDPLPEAGEVINAEGMLLLPGMIDDQVHFREPGLTHKGDLHTESRAAVAGGITSFMEMPNTIPQAVTIATLEEKYKLAAKKSLANYSFYLGTTNTNIDEIKAVDPKQICGVKIFMGSSTGDMVVNDDNALERVFEQSPVLIATHCEDDPTIKANQQKFIEKFGENIPYIHHPDIRSREACYKSSSKAVGLAKKHGSRLHILHLSTRDEMALFDSGPIENKKITAEACVHHLWFTREDYKTKGAFIKWNPAVKDVEDREALRQAVTDDRIDIIATDHAPHTLDEKTGIYTKTPSGGPLVQHALVALLELVKQGVFTIEKVVEKTAHNPAKLFGIEKRGFIRPGYFADLVLIDPEKPWTVSKENILYKCGWSPFEGTTFSHSVIRTFVNGNTVYKAGKIVEGPCGMRLSFQPKEY